MSLSKSKVIFVSGVVGILFAGYSVVTSIQHEINLKANACVATTQALHEMGSSELCAYVDIKNQVNENLWQGTAKLTNDEMINITIESVNDDKAYVHINN